MVERPSGPQGKIVFGTGTCGHAGQIFRTGNCAHCYIADLEYFVSVVKETTGCDSVTEAVVRMANARTLIESLLHTVAVQQRGVRLRDEDVQELLEKAKQWLAQP